MAATDASVKGFSMGGCWIIADIDQKFKKEKVLYHKSWKNNTSRIAEIIVLLELLTVLEQKG